MIGRAQIAAAALSALFIAALLAPPISDAAFPGRANGRIAYYFEGVETIKPDGTGRRILARDGSEPSYSADGNQIAFAVRSTLRGVGLWVSGS
jgi:hypothetical protein